MDLNDILLFTKLVESKTLTGAADALGIPKSTMSRRLSQLEAALGGRPVDLVLSDMAPNMSGMDAVDQPRAMYLAELARDFADAHLRPGGAFVIKLFQGNGIDEYIRDLRKRYTQVKVRKPEASRNRSPEVYAMAAGKRAETK